MKWFRNLLLCAAFSLTIPFFIPNANAVEPLTITIGNGFAQRGEYISVPIALHNDSSEFIDSISNLNITFDDTALEWASEPYSSFNFFYGEGNTEPSSANVTFHAANSGGSSDSGVLCTLNFKVKADAPLQDVSLTLSVGRVYNYDLEPVNCTFEDGSIIVFKPGSLSMREKVSSVDVTYLRRHLAGWDDYQDTHYKIAGRVSNGGVGEPDAFDITTLRRHVAGWSDYQFLPVGVAFSEGQSIRLSIKQNETELVPIRATNRPSFDGVIFTLTYDPLALELLDFAAQAESGCTTEGAIPNTPLTIISHSHGVITFTYTQDVPTGQVWSGVMTLAQFRALQNGVTVLSVE